MRYRPFPRQKPGWWPSGESWPPIGHPDARTWHRMRAHLFARVGALIGLLLLFACGGFFVLVTLLAGILGLLGVPSDAAGLAWVYAVISLLAIFAGLAVILRSLRRVARPIGDVMEAAGSVAEGDYSTRVQEHGPREVRALTRAFNSMADRLQAQDKQRRNLLADITHELRTPLTVIQGNLEGLLDGVYERDDAHLQILLDETSVISRLIDDLRTLALAESGELKLQKEPVDLIMLVSETVNSFQTQADKAGVELSVDTAPDFPALDLDVARIRQVLANLIANALHYTQRGGRITVRLSIENKYAGDIEISVSDTGAGISTDDLPHIFDRFYKSSRSRGMGLGLAIAKNLVAAHGGEISAWSEEGQGTTIRFTLPNSAPTN